MLTAGNQLMRAGAVGGVLAIAGATGLASADDGIAREAIGPRAEQLAEMERQPFPSELWGGLESWANGEAVTADSIDGKVVLVVSWASWNRQSTSVLRRVESLASRHGDDLIVVGVHHERGFDGAANAARRISFPYAHDASGEFRSGLNIDGDPDFYLIDRAGQLRFADIRSESLNDAVQMLVDESASDASTLNERLAAEAAAAEAEARRPTRVNQGGLVGEIPEVAFDKPLDSEYTKINWPLQFVDANQSNRAIPQEDYPTIVLPSTGYIGGQPKFDGRVRLIFFFHPDVRVSHTPILERMNRLQQDYGRDLQVIGIISNIDPNSQTAKDLPAGASDPERMERLGRRFHETLALEYPLILDEGRGLATQLADANKFDSQSDQNMRDGNVLLFAALLGTDERVRGLVGFGTWTTATRGAFFPDWEADLEALSQRVIELDPGAKARREAEAEYLRKQRQGG
ncbi:MAG: hypothetical protein AAF747_08030 [Planctomycetota bacterium]